MSDYKWKDGELEEVKETFTKFDADGNGSVTVDELGEVFKSVGDSVPGYKLRDMIAEVDKDNSGTVEWNEFVHMMEKIRSGKQVGGFGSAVKKVEKLKRVGGTSAASTSGTTHSFQEEEIFSFADWINYALVDDESLKDLLPVNAEDDEDLFKKVHNGILLCKLINSSVPNTIDPRTINTTKLNKYNITENQTLALNSAAAIGCNIVNIGEGDMMEGTKHLVLGLLWQIIRAGLFAKININACPGMSRLLHDDEELSDLLALPPDALLLRWFNYHLANAGVHRRVNNFGADIKDSECYIHLLAQIAPKELGINTGALTIGDDEERAEAMLQSADQMHCRKFVRPKDVVKGNPKLNMAFVAHLFNTHPGMEPEEDDKWADFDLGEMDETREERTFRNWMNSLGVKPFVHNLYGDLSDGLVLLQLFDRIQPGIVDWTRVNQPPFKKMGGNMKKVENLNYAIDVGKALRFSIVGIGGKDIFDGIKTLTLAVIWQAMRAYTLKVLQTISGSSKRITDPQIVKFVNEKLDEAGKSSRITGFKDPSIATSLCVIDLVDAIKPGSVDYSFVTAAETDEEKLANAKFAISMSRKIGAGVYALPEDLVEVKPKMVMTVFACLLAKAFAKKA